MSTAIAARERKREINMLRISTDTTPQTTVITVEGRLAGPLVHELERIWHEVRVGHDLKPTIIDLCGVTFIDSKGKLVLRMMCDEGASFQSCGADVTATIEAIKQCSEARSKQLRGTPV